MYFNKYREAVERIDKKEIEIWSEETLVDKGNKTEEKIERKGPQINFKGSFFYIFLGDDSKCEDWWGDIFQDWWEWRIRVKKV